MGPITPDGGTTLHDTTNHEDSQVLPHGALALHPSFGCFESSQQSDKVPFVLPGISGPYLGSCTPERAGGIPDVPASQKSAR